MERIRAFRRKKNYSKANRKKNILKAYHITNWYKYDGQFIKGKIHCSCGICSAKTNNKHGKSHWSKPTEYKHSDLIKIERIKSQIKEYEGAVS